MNYMLLKQNFTSLENECVTRNENLKDLNSQYIRLIKLREDILMINLCSLNYEELEDVDVIKNNILELFIILKMSIRYKKGLSTANELESLNELYKNLANN